MYAKATVYVCERVDICFYFSSEKVRKFCGVKMDKRTKNERKREQEQQKQLYHQTFTTCYNNALFMMQMMMVSVHLFG